VLVGKVNGVGKRGSPKVGELQRKSKELLAILEEEIKRIEAS
jgi:hypothetical protein